MENFQNGASESKIPSEPSFAHRSVVVRIVHERIDRCSPHAKELLDSLAGQLAGIHPAKSVVAWIGAEMEFALSQAVASGDAFEHRPSECGHCVQNFLAALDFRDLPGEAAGFELGRFDNVK